jgi:pimeloyl-ACP methyl ester carboxylesterase
MDKYVNLDHPIYFLGHSSGPTWIFKWLQQPNSISIAGLILVSTGVQNSDLMVGGPLLFRALPLWLLRCLQPLLTQTFLKIGFAQLTHPELIQAAKESNNTNDMQVVCFYYQAHDWLEDISSFRSLRTLVLHGVEDGVIPIRYGQVVAIQLDTKLIAVENASHMVLLEQPAEVAEQILLFWRNKS